MLFGLFILLCYWLAGEWISNLSGIPVPGSVIGLLGLWVTLMVLKKVPESLRSSSTALLRYLTLLFVPAGAGLILHTDTLQAHGISLLVIITLSSMLAALSVLAVFRIFKVKE